jgi:hypothetical protein
MLFVAAVVVVCSCDIAVGCAAANVCAAALIIIN